MAASAAAAAAILRAGTVLSCKTWSFHSTRTFVGCFPSSSKANVKSIEVAVVPSRYPLHIEKESRRSALSFPLLSRRSFFRASLEAEAAVDTSTDATLSSSVPITDSATGAPSSVPSADPLKDAADALDIRVGRILRAWRHPEADSLYVEEVDIGEAEPRTICSGLVNYIPLDELQDAKVVVLANLKPRNMRGVKSNGMLMAASDASHENVELLLPPEGSIPGERIWFGSEEERENAVTAATPNQVQKKKIWELVQPHLKTDGSCVAALGVHPMRTSAGTVVCRSLQNANIS